jgi:hypothetical protein
LFKYNKYKVPLAILFVICFLLSTQKSQAADPVNYKGKNFWVGFLQSEVGPDPFELSLHITSDVKTSVRIRLEAAKIDSRKETTWEQSYLVTPGTVTTVVIPEEYTFKAKSGKSTHKGLYIEAREDVMVVAKNSSGTSSDATVVIPIKSLGSEYYIMQYHVLNKKYPSQYLIIATEDSTEVEIKNTSKSFGGKPAHIPFTIKLNKGDAHMVQARKDLTGSIVREKNGKKIAVFSGATCTYVPRYCQSCDHLYEQVQPTQSWGFEFAVVPFDNRDKYVLRILAKEDETYVDVDGERYTIEKAGKYIELELKDEIFYVRTSRPVMVAKYTIGTRCDKRRGDPAMVMVKPLLSFEGHTELPVMVTENITDYYITVMVKTRDINKLTVNGKTIESDYMLVPYKSEYAYAHIEVKSGNNKIECDCKYNFTSYGFGWYESYAY